MLLIPDPSQIKCSHHNDTPPSYTIWVMQPPPVASLPCLASLPPSPFSPLPFLSPALTWPRAAPAALASNTSPARSTTCTPHTSLTALSLIRATPCTCCAAAAPATAPRLAFPPAAPAPPSAPATTTPGCTTAWISKLGPGKVAAGSTAITGSGSSSSSGGCSFGGGSSCC